MRRGILVFATAALATISFAQRPEFQWLKGFATGFDAYTSAAQVQYLADGGSFVADATGDAMIFQIPGVVPVRAIDMTSGRFDGVTPDQQELVAHRNGSHGIVHRFGDGQFLRAFGNIPEQFYNVRMSRNGRFVAVYSIINALFQIYDLTTAQVISIRQTWMPSGPFTFTDNGEKVAGANFQGQTSVLDTLTGNLLFTIEGNRPAFTPSGDRLYVQRGNGTVGIHDGQSGVLLSTLPTNWQGGGIPFVTPDSRHLLGTTTDGFLELWDIPTGLLKWRSAVFVRAASGASFSPDGTEVMVSGAFPSLTRQFAMENGRLLATISASQATNYSASHAAVSGDGRLGFRHDRNGVQVLTTDDGQVLNEFVGPSFSHFAVNHDGSRLSSNGIGNSISIYDTSSGSIVANLNGHPNGATQTEFSEDGAHLYSRDFSKVIKWRLSTGAVEYEIPNFNNLRTFDLNAEGTLLAAGQSDGSVAVFDANSGQQVFSLATGISVQSVAFSPQSNVLVVSHGNKTIEAFDVATQARLWTTTEAFTPYNVTFVTPTVFVVRRDFSHQDGKTAVNTFRDVVTGNLLSQFDQMATYILPVNSDELFLSRASFVGKAWNPVTVPKVAPSNANVVFGQTMQGDFSSLGLHDDNSLVIRNFMVPSQSVAPITVDVIGTSPTDNPRIIQFKTLSRSVGGNILVQKIELYNWVTEAYDTVDTTTTTVSNEWAFAVLNASGELSRYVRPGVKAMKARYSLRPSGIQATSGFTVKHDLAVWYVGR